MGKVSHQGAQETKQVRAAAKSKKRAEATLKRVVHFIQGKGSLRFINKSPIEKLVEFLKLNNHDQLAEDLANYYTHTSKTPEDVVKFILNDIAPVVYALPIPGRIDSEEDAKYNARLLAFYQDAKFALQTARMREFKHLLSQVHDQFELPKPRLKVLGKNVRDDNGHKTVIVSDSQKTAQQLADYAFSLKQVATAGKEIAYSTFYSYDEKETVSAAERKAKARTRNWKRVAFMSTIIVALLIGVAESAAPYSIYTSVLPKVVISFMPLVAPFILPALVVTLIGLIAGASGLIVNAMLFQGGSFETVKDLFFKNRFFRNADGSKASKAKIAVNALALFVAAFAAITISVLSWYFSFLPAALALGVLAISVIGWQGLLTNDVMKLLDLNNVKRFVKFLKGLLWEPLVAIRNEFRELNSLNKYLNILRHTGLWVLNVVAVAAMFGGSAVVITSTFLFFVDKFLLIPALVGVIGKLGVYGLVGGAEIALGTFFSMNVFRLVGALRGVVAWALGLEVKQKQSQDMQNLDAILNPKDSAGKALAKEDSSFRKTTVRVGLTAAGFAVVAALINAGGFALGYFNFLGILAAVGYAASSIGGNAFAAVRAVVAPQPMMVFPKEAVLSDLSSKSDKGLEASVSHYSPTKKAGEGDDVRVSSSERLGEGYDADASEASEADDEDARSLGEAAPTPVEALLAAPVVTLWDLSSARTRASSPLRGFRRTDEDTSAFKPVVATYRQ